MYLFQDFVCKENVESLDYEKVNSERNDDSLK